MVHYVTLSEYLNKKREQKKSETTEPVFYADEQKKPQLQYLLVTLNNDSINYVWKCTVIYYCEYVFDWTTYNSYYKYHYTVLMTSDEDGGYWYKGFYDYHFENSAPFARYITETVQLKIADSCLVTPKVKLPYINIFE